jgi:hypothetical protein
MFDCVLPTRSGRTSNAIYRRWLRSSAQRPPFPGPASTLMTSAHAQPAAIIPVLIFIISCVPGKFSAPCYSPGTICASTRT